MLTPAYSTLFSCLHDEPEPVGYLGRGTHYSVFRSVEWLDVVRTPLAIPQVHDFAIIWDEDHDTRVIEVVESIYMAGLLSPIQFIGERKGILTLIVAARFYFAYDQATLEAYIRQITEIAQNANHGDCWPVEVGMFDRSPGAPQYPHQTELRGLIAAEEHRVVTYLRNIDSLWGLGTKDFVSKPGMNFAVPLVPPAPPAPI